MTDTIELAESIAELRRKLEPSRRAGKTIGLVPTMGALHEGHVSLVNASCAECDLTVVSIFVNPTQFAPDEDLESYPRTPESDQEKLAAAGADIVFCPNVEEVYPDGYSTSVSPPDVAKSLEGEYRPTHFAGVCTVVLKLFNMVQPDRAYFGQKDFQQVSVLKSMVRDLNVPVDIVVCPIVRDNDGLAMSSRNAYLDTNERKIGLALNQTLAYVREQIVSGNRDAYELMAEMRQRLIDAGVTSIDYTMIADPVDLKLQSEIRLPAVVFIAAFIGKNRLIDNDLIQPESINR